MYYSTTRDPETTADFDDNENTKTSHFRWKIASEVGKVVYNNELGEISSFQYDQQQRKRSLCHYQVKSNQKHTGPL